MTDYGRRSARSASVRGSFQASQSISPGFLNLLNPLSRGYQGYLRADQSVVEEDEEETLQDNATSMMNKKAEASRLKALRPNRSNGTKSPGESSSDDEVPQSFMIEAATTDRKSNVKRSKTKGKEKQQAPPRKKPILPTTNEDVLLSAMPPRPSELYPNPILKPQSQPNRTPMRGLDAYERALWNWVNVYNLDAFLQDVYSYYEGGGIYCIALSRGLNLLTVGFVIAFSTFLLGCIDYSRFRPEQMTRLSDVVVDHCISKFSGVTLLFFLFFGAVFVWQVFAFGLNVMSLLDMHRFYTHLLGIPDADIQTISWPEVVRRIGAIREDNPNTAISSASHGNSSASVTAKLDAHDIANRIMRQENYLIALFNKDLLDLQAHLPAPLNRLLNLGNGKSRTLTRALEWNLRFCLMQYLFDPSGKVKKAFLKRKHKKELVDGLQRRFVFMAILNVIFVPFIVLYLVMYSFFRYFEEYHKNPSSIGGRGYTPYAEWKFREFNELPHNFKRRLDESYPAAAMYIGRFPNRKLTIIMRFVSFIAGSFAAVLLLASVIDPDLFLHFEVTPHRTVLFYIGLFGSILAVARGMIPEENMVYDPEELMREIVQSTHYMPAEWKDQLHSEKVHTEYGKLFALKIMIFAQELLSVVLTPFILWRSLPPCAPAIVEFFREFTVHVDSLGYVCSFAVFDFKRHGNVNFGAPVEAQDRRLMSNEGKMEKSFLNFKAAHPDWVPADPSGSLYLSRMADLNASRRLRMRHRFPQRSIVGFGPHPEPVAEESNENTAQNSTLMPIADLQQRGSIDSNMGVPTNIGSIPGTSMYDTRIPSREPAAGIRESTDLPAEDIELDGGVGSGLGGSYVDGKLRRNRSDEPTYASQQENDDLEDGGLITLLAQIYGTAGPGRTRGL